MSCAHAQTKAHDLDLNTLETIAKRNMQLEDYLRRIQNHDNHSSAWATSHPTSASAAWQAPAAATHSTPTNLGDLYGSPAAAPEWHGISEDRHELHGA